MSSTGGLLGGALDPQGPMARSAAALWWLMAALGGLVFVLVVALLVAGLRRGRAGPARVEPGGPETGSSRRWLVGGGVLLPSVVLVVVLGATVAAMRDVPVQAPDGALVVEVTGHQYWWEIRYPAEGAVVANELHLPVGRPVALRLRSADVIHSFWVPALGGKMDALPDGVNTLVLQADEAGEHTSECAEFCGVQHTNMSLLVVAEEPDAFRAWVAAQAAPAAPVNSTGAAGADVFARACSRCHAVRPATEAEPAERGPDLTHFASRRTIGAIAENEPEALRRWISDPHAMKTGVLMPAVELDPHELDAVVTYLEGLR